jgi:hypothetical protein
MILFWLLCVGLLLGALAVRLGAREILAEVRLRVYGKRVPVRRRHLPAVPECGCQPGSRPAGWPPPRVVTRAGP